MIIWIKPVSFGAAATVLAFFVQVSLVSAAEPFTYDESERPIIQPWFGWDAGVLTFHSIQENRTVSFSLSFEGNRMPVGWGFDSYGALRISTKHWELDLHPYVDELRFPLPNRIDRQQRHRHLADSRRSSRAPQKPRFCP